MTIAPSKSDVRRGFTLIELLVVIAIIGILSSVVLASLNTARSKGTDAKIQSEIRSIQVNAEIFYDNAGNSYGTSSTAQTSLTCTFTAGMFYNDSNPNIRQVVADLKSATSAYDPTCNIAANGTAYAIQHALTSSAGGATLFCADSTGKVGTSTTALGTNTVCP